MRIALSLSKRKLENVASAFIADDLFSALSGAPRTKTHGSSTRFVGRNPPKHTLFAFIHVLKTRVFLRRRVNKNATDAHNLRGQSPIRKT